MLESPWRSVFERVRALVGGRRDEHGVLGSINWLRSQMQARGANPNVVRNIIYRDKGKVADKRTLFDILTELWAVYGDAPLQAPELEALFLAEGDADQEVAELLGRDKRRVYSTFVSGVRARQSPKLLITGRPGSGKTLLLDYVQQALALPPRAAETVRLEVGADLAVALTRLAVALQVPRDVFEAKLVKVAAQSAFAVQADAQAEVARSLLEAARSRSEPLALLLHLSQALGEQRNLSVAPLRLNTPDVPRVSAAEWLWLSVLEPLSRLEDVSLLVSTANLPLRAPQALGGFAGPVKLNPPSAAEARRFVRARLPHLESAQHEAIVQRSGRSFEELRTVTLLAQLREPVLEQGDHSQHADQLGHLLTAGDERLRDFLASLAVVSLPDFPTFGEDVLRAVRNEAWPHLSGLETAFLDPLPDSEYRPFSRQFARTLRSRFEQGQRPAYRRLHRKAAAFYEPQALASPGGEAAARYLHHLFEARAWDALCNWLHDARPGASVPQTLLHRLWAAAECEPLAELFETVALHVASHYVRLGSYSHPDALSAFEVLARSETEEVRLWTLLKRAEGAVLKGRFEVAETLLQGWTASDAADLNIEHVLLEASLARWHSSLERAADLVNKVARPQLERVSASSAGRLVAAKVAVWAGLIAKDKGDLEGALQEFGSVVSADDLVRARVAFQSGDVLLQLGRFDAALAAFDEAVARAERSDALVQEQSRYLSRRGSLQRLRGDLGAAAEDFARALSGLALGALDGLELAFWQAKVEDERALLLLAQGDFGAAVRTLQRNREVFLRYEASHGVDAAYRTLRSGLHSALAYGLRGWAQPYRLPFARRAVGAFVPADLHHAQRLAQRVGAAVAERAATRAAYESLQRRSLLVGSLLAATAPEAVAQAEGALGLSRYEHQEAEACAYLAAAQLRADEPAAALASARRGAAALLNVGRPLGTGEHGDVGLLAWLHSLRLQAVVAAEGGAAGFASLLASLQDGLQEYREPLLRALGESLEAALGNDARRLPSLRRVFGDALGDEDVRLPDALAAFEGRLELEVEVA